jgi:hypothetical protein
VLAFYKKIKPSLEKLCYDKFANYIIQVLIPKVPLMREEFSTRFIKNLDDMLSN